MCRTKVVETSLYFAVIVTSPGSELSKPVNVTSLIAGLVTSPLLQVAVTIIPVSSNFSSVRYSVLYVPETEMLFTYASVRFSE